MATEYKYNELNQNRKEIRLLRFDQNAEYPPERLKCRIETASLLHDFPPKYYAVSYACGDASRTALIDIDDRVAIRIPETSESALRHVRNHLLNKSTSSVKIWIDAICISQSDNEEKSWQVAMMHEVYSKADTVLIWLGIDRNGTAPKAIASIQAMIEDCKAVVGSIEKENLHNFFWTQKYNGFEPGLLPQYDFEAMNEFYTGPWFDRLWIVQEVLLAKRTLCCRGPHVIDWHEVGLAAKWMHFRQDSRQKSGPNVDDIKQLGNASMIWWHGIWKDLTPSSLLEIGIQQKSTMREDKVFGMLGLLNARFSDTSSEIKAKYGTPLREVYTQATRYVLGQNDFRVVQFANWVAQSKGKNEAEKDQWPSWVPRFDFGTHPDDGSPTLIKPYTELNCPDRSFIKPSGGEQNAAQSPYQLTVQGTVLGEVAWVSEILTVDLICEHFNILAKQVASAWKRIGGKSPEASTEFFRTDFASTLVLGYLDSIQPNLLAEFVPFMKMCQKYAPRPGPRHFWESWADVEHARPFVFAMRVVALNRRLFTTVDGKMIGMGPAGAARGDSLCIIHGATVPFILRQTGHHWQLVGDANVEEVAENGDITQLFADCVRDGPRQQFVLI